MAFLDELKSWLAGPRTVTHAAPGRGELFDASPYRRALYGALAEMESEARRSGEDGSDAFDVPGATRWRIQRLHSRWSEAGVLERFVRVVQAELRGGAAMDVSEEEMRARVSDVLRLALGLEVTAPSLVLQWEMERIARRADPATDAVSWKNPERYAHELGLVRANGETWALSPPGETLLELVGRGAVRWLLTLECATSAGPKDDLRACQEVFGLLTRRPRIAVNDDDPDDNDWPFPWSTASRLDDFGVVICAVDDGAPISRVALRDDWAPFVKEIAEGHMTPFVSLAETLLARESEAALRTSHVGAVDRSAEIVAAQVRHTKMVVHEIRNALVPVQHALRGLYAAVKDAVPTEEIDRHRALIDPGIHRLFHFVAELKQTADLASKLPDPFDPLDAAREAVAIARQGLRLDVTLPTPTEAWRVRGDRNRFVLACVNLLRNAAQASERPSAAVCVEALRNASGERLVLTFDDDGPGVPEAHRETIFQPGFALRPEGTGQGLALVRDVVEVELGGVVRCEASTKLGGARFVLVVPIDGRTEP